MSDSVVKFTLSGGKSLQGYKVSVKFDISKGALKAVDVFFFPVGSFNMTLLYTEVFDPANKITHFERVSDKVGQNFSSFSDKTLFVKAGVQLDTGLQIESGVHTFPGL
jgi:hypothetical protein